MTDEVDANLPATSKGIQVAAGGAVQALIPQNIEEAFKVAVAFKRAEIAPKGLDSTEKILAVIMGGAELGFAPMQALASFAWINGRLCIYGDAIPALLWTNKIKIREWFESADFVNFPDNMTAWCEITRPDGEVIARSFSVGQAKRAKLWNKKGRDGQDTPWITYPDRMLQMRARSWCSRDGAADVLKGRPIVEEVQDIVVTAEPRQGSGLMGRLKKHGFHVDNVENGINGDDPPTEDASFEEVSPTAETVQAVVTAMRHAVTRADLETARHDAIDIQTPAPTVEEQKWLEETYATRLRELARNTPPPSTNPVDAEFTDDAKATTAETETETVAGEHGETLGTPDPDANPPSGPLAGPPSEPEIVAGDGVDPDALADWAASYLRGLPRLETKADVDASWASEIVTKQREALQKVKPAMHAALVRAMSDRVRELQRKGL